MGGKTKQSQRTKNNVRPSSSGRSALLLSNVKLDTGVMNVAGTELPALFPTLVAPSIDPMVSPELQLCIKKLNKKDPITKTKALQELSDVVTNCTVDDVVAALPSWAHFYKILTADPDRKVREATQACHGTIVNVCGRRVAPHLKQLMPAWLQAQYDEHAPAMTNAQNSLAKTFPDSKLPEVISFCKNEVVAHLIDNLVGTGESAFIRKTDTPEEKELQLARIATSSLHGAQYTAQHLPAAHDGWLWEQLHTLLQANKFWKGASHADSRIRAAWFAAVGRIIERYKSQYAEQYGQKTLRILIGAKEQNPLAAAQLWDCLLLFMYNVQEWHKYLDKMDLLNKRILDVLESGGWGDARHLSTMLLPLLAHLPQTMLTKEFYIAFFDAVFNGLDKKTILSSKSERQSWITSLDECLRYLSIQQNDYVLEIVTSVHRTWLEKILSDTHDGQIRNNLIKYSANSMAVLVKYWLKQSKEGNSEKYDQLIRNFWQNVGSTITAQIDKVSTNHTEIDRLIDGHILVLQTLKSSFVQEAKKQQNIKFDGDLPTVKEHQKNTQVIDPSIVERYNHNLHDLVEKICGHYFEFASKKQISNPVLTPLTTILMEFDCKSLFVGIARQFECDSIYKFYEKVLRSWLAGDTMRCKAVVDIVFLTMKHLSEREQEALFDTFKQFPPSVVEWCVSLSLSHPHCLASAVRRWLRGPLVEATMSTVCTRVIEHGDSKAKDLLCLCLNPDAKGETIISERAVSAILSQFSVGVGDVSAPALEQTARLAAALGTALAAPGLAGLVLALFRLSVRVPRGDPRLCVHTWGEVRAAWQDGLQALGAAERAAALAAAAAIVHEHLTLDSNLNTKLLPSEPTENTRTTNTVDIERIEHAVSLCPYLLSNNTQQDIHEIVDFTRQIFDIPLSDPTLVESYALRHDVIKSKINCPFEDDNTKPILNDLSEVRELAKDDLIAYVNTCLFRAVYLRTILLHRVDEDLEDTWCNDLLADEYFATELCKVLHDCMVVNSLYDGYAFWRHYDLIKQTKNRLDTLLEDIINESSQQINTRILNSLSELAATKGYYWSYARRYFEVQAKLDGAENNRGITESGQSHKVTAENSEVTTESSELKLDSSEAKPSESETTLDVENIQEIITGSGFFHTLQANDSWPCKVSTSLRTEYLLMLRSFYSAHSNEPAVVGGAFVGDVTSGQGECNADVIVNAYYAHNHVMLYEKDITAAPWAQVVGNAAVATYLAELIKTRGWDLPAHHWDFATITLCSLVSSVEKSKRAWGSTKVALVTRSVLSLFTTIEHFISTVKETCVKKQPSEHVAQLPQEWKDIFAPDLSYSLFSLLVFVLESASTTTITANHISTIDALMQVTSRLQWDLVPSQHRLSAFTLKRVATSSANVLKEPTHYAFKYLAYCTLKMIMKPLVLEDAEKLAAWSADATTDEGEDKEKPQFTLLHYDDAFYRLQEVVDTAVSHVKLCEASCELVPFSDVHSLALGWFLLADAMAAQCRLARGDLKHHYIEIYREQKYAEPLLTTALRLLPADVFAAAQGAAAAPQPAHVELFTSVQQLDVYKSCTSRSIGACACACVSSVIRGAGGGEARGWRGAAPHKHASLLDALVRTYITPQVVKEEFSLVQQRASELDDTEITIHWSTYELTCVLTVEERPIELKVQLAREHPLTLPRLQAAENAPARNINWLVMYMGYQNGTLLNALKMWIEAINNKVERSAQCYICYCRLHFASGKLPGVTCYQCRNKFHTACLRKWFSTSNKSNCPLCRTTF